MRKDSFGAAAIRERESLGSHSASEYDEQVSYGTYSGILNLLFKIYKNNI